MFFVRDAASVADCKMTLVASPMVVIMNHKLLLTTWAVLAVPALPTVAGQIDGLAAKATALHDEGTKLLLAGRVAEATVKISEAVRIRSKLYPEGHLDLADSLLALSWIEYTRGDRATAASLLGIGRTTLYRKMKEYNLEIESRARYNVQPGD